MEIQATRKRSNSGRREKLKKKGFSGDDEARGVDGWACRRQTHLLEEACVKTASHVTRAVTRRRVNSRARPEIGECGHV